MRRAALVALIMAAACGGEQAEPDSDQAASEAETAPVSQPPGPAPLALVPAQGPPGTEVEISKDNLVIRAKVEVGFGNLSEHQIIASGNADENGRYSGRVTVPAGTAPGTYFFFLADQETANTLTAATQFVVTAP